MKTKRNQKPRRMNRFNPKHKQNAQSKHILMHPHYPIGHATGMTEEEWQEFANEYEK